MIRKLKRCPFCLVVLFSLLAAWTALVGMVLGRWRNRGAAKPSR